MTDRIWNISQPVASKFAEAGFSEGPSVSEAEGRDFVEVFWDEGSDLVGDLVWVADRPVFRIDIFLELKHFLPETPPYEVRFVERPARFGGKSISLKPRIKPPYRGPAFGLLRGLPKIEPDLERSSVKDLHWNENLRSLSGEWDGVESKDFLSKASGPQGEVCYVLTREPRAPFGGVIIPKDRRPRDAFFEIPNAGWLLCTDEVRFRMLDLGLTNIDFLEWGEFL